MTVSSFLRASVESAFKVECKLKCKRFLNVKESEIAVAYFKNINNN